MAFLLTDLRTRVTALLQEDAKFLTSDEIDEAINQALLQVNHDKPFTVPVDITGDGTQTYALPATFEKEFSDIKTVEFPAGEIPPIFLDREDDWRFYEDPSKPSGSQLRLLMLSRTPSATETIRVTIVIERVLTETTSNLNATSFSAMVYKTLVLANRALAQIFSQTTNPTIEADAVDYGGRSQNFLFLAERWETQYKQIIGFGEESIEAAQAILEADILFAHGEDMLFHPARDR